MFVSMSFTNTVFEILCQPLQFSMFSLVGKFQELSSYSMEARDELRTVLRLTAIFCWAHTTAPKIFSIAFHFRNHNSFPLRSEVEPPQFLKIEHRN